MTARPLFALALLLALGAMAPPDWVDQDPAYRAFLGELQGDIGANRRQHVVQLIGYPLHVNERHGASARSRSRVYRSAAAALAHFGRIFTPRVRTAILGQRYEDLFARDQGIMIGDGEVWFDHICQNRSCTRLGPVRIRAINP